MPAWAIFELKTETTINEISLLNGQKRTDHRLICFQLTIKANNEWFSPTKLSVREDAHAIIESDGKITLNSGIHYLTLDFNTIYKVQAIRLDVIQTDAGNNNVVLNEIIPKFGKLSFSIL